MNCVNAKQIASWKKNSSRWNGGGSFYPTMACARASFDSIAILCQCHNREMTFDKFDCRNWFDSSRVEFAILAFNDFDCLFPGCISPHLFAAIHADDESSAHFAFGEKEKKASQPHNSLFKWDNEERNTCNKNLIHPIYCNASTHFICVAFGIFSLSFYARIVGWRL